MKIVNFYKYRHMHQSSDFRFTGHRHGRYEANIVLKGTIEITCSSSIISVSQKQFAIWKPGVFHMSRVLSPEGAELVSLEFDLSDNFFPKNEFAVFDLDESDMALANILEDECGTITEISSKLAEAFFMRLEKRESNLNLSNSWLSAVYHSAVSFMGDKLDCDIDVSDVAKHCGVCLTTLKKAFSEYAGKGVRAYYIDMKIHKAKEMLLCGSSVSQISDMLGFSSPAYFSQCFKREVGMPPQKYRSTGV